jgi:hypothetical protein
MSGLHPSDPSQHWGPPPPAAFHQPPRWPMFVTLAIALIGVAVALDAGSQYLVTNLQKNLRRRLIWHQPFGMKLTQSKQP